MCLNQKILKLRLENNLTKVEFAEALGISERTVRRWEKGNSKIYESNLIKICAYFGIPMSYFEEEETKQNE